MITKVSVIETINQPVQRFRPLREQRGQSLLHSAQNKPALAPENIAVLDTYPGTLTTAGQPEKSL